MFASDGPCSPEPALPSLELSPAAEGSLDPPPHRTRGFPNLPPPLPTRCRM